VGRAWQGDHGRDRLGGQGARAWSTTPRATERVVRPCAAPACSGRSRGRPAPSRPRRRRTPR
jgi:hypothetical protein